MLALERILTSTVGTFGSLEHQFALFDDMQIRISRLDLIFQQVPRLQCVVFFPFASICLYLYVVHLFSRVCQDGTALLSGNSFGEVCFYNIHGSAEAGLSCVDSGKTALLPHLSLGGFGDAANSTAFHPLAPGTFAVVSHFSNDSWPYHFCRILSLKGQILTVCVSMMSSQGTGQRHFELDTAVEEWSADSDEVCYALYTHW